MNIMDKLALLKKYKITNNNANKTISKISFKNIDDYGYIVSRSNRNSTVNNLVNLITAARELSLVALKWSMVVEDQIRAALIDYIESIQGQLKANDLWASRIYKNLDPSNKKKWSNHSKILVKAMKKFRREDEDTYLHIIKTWGHIPLRWYAHMLIFGQIKRIIDKMKLKHKKEIFKIIGVVDENIMKMLNLIAMARNSFAHGENPFKWHVKGFVMPRNIVSSAIGGSIVKRSKGSDKAANWNNNLFAFVITLKFYFPKSVYSKFIFEYTECLKRISHKIPGNYYYHVLNGGAIVNLKRIESLPARKLQTHKNIINLTRSELIEYICEKTGDDKESFRGDRKEKILEYFLKVEDLMI